MSNNIVSSATFSNISARVKDELCGSDKYKLIFIKEGSSTLRISEKEYTCAAPCLILLGISDPYLFDIKSESYERYIISLDPDVACEDLSSLDQLFFTHREGFCPVLPIKENAELFFGLAKEICDEIKYSGTPNVWAKALTTKILKSFPELLFAPSNQKERIVFATKATIERDPSVAFDLDDLATDSYISRYYLSHIFSDVTGYSIKNYILSCRLALSCRLLCSDKIPIGEIASRSGFPDMSNFSRYFKDIVGMTPTQYRKLSEDAKLLEPKFPQRKTRKAKNS